MFDSLKKGVMLAALALALQPAAVLADTVMDEVEDTVVAVQDTALDNDNAEIAEAAVVDEEAMTSASLSDDELGEYRAASGFGGFNWIDMNAHSSGNSVTGGTTGNNDISTDAFGNANGIFTVIQNSGNNVIIQSSMIVNTTIE